MGVVLVTLAATLLIQAGYFLWKLAADRQPVIGRAPARQVLLSHLRDPWWLGGMAATAGGWLLFVQATGIGEISLVQPLMSVGDLLLVAMTVIFLGERLGRIEWGGVALTVAGAALLSAGDKGAATAVPAYGALALLLALCVLAAAGLLWSSRGSRSVELPLAAAVGIAFGAGAVLTEAMTAWQQQGGRAALAPSLLLNPWLLPVIACNVVGLVMLQAAFQRGRAATIVPVQLAIANAVALAAGLVAFDEAVGPWRIAAVALICAGTALLHVGHAGRPAAP